METIEVVEMEGMEMIEEMEEYSRAFGSLAFYTRTLAYDIVDAFVTCERFLALAREVENAEQRASILEEGMQSVRSALTYSLGMIDNASCDGDVAPFAEVIEDVRKMIDQVRDAAAAAPLRRNVRPPRRRRRRQ